VQYEVEIKYNGTLFFPVWLPREDENFSVEQSSISIVCPLSYTIRYKAFNYTGEPAQTTEKDKKIMTWQTSGLPAIEDEFASPSWYELNTVVLFAPTEFEIQNYRGSMNNWQEFGKFVYSLKQGRDQLPDNIKQAVHQMTDNITDPKEKIGKLYEYMQKNTRYISIQLGIGGWQPFDAKYVATKAYGDCKALSNYMYSLLNEAGIASSYTLIKAGRNANKVMADFPSQQFNHVILCVPLQKDTVWLECTSQTLPAGYLSDFTCDRYALLINEDGGSLVRTPKYGMKENLQTRHITATLDEEATLHVKAFSRYGGVQQDKYHELINNLSKDKVKEQLHEELDFATYEISSFDYKETRSSLPAVEESLDIVVSNYASITGKRLFIIPNVMTRTHRKLPADSARKFDLELGFEFKDVDTVEINLPAGYIAESMPQDVSVNSKFGKYNCSVRLSGNQLIYYRSIEHNGGRFPAKDYAELVKFYETIYKADRNKVVLVKKETQAAQKGG
jgi:carbonic anhydrase